jgi:hypothetical protein
MDRIRLLKEARAELPITVFRSAERSAASL